MRAGQSYLSGETKVLTRLPVGHPEGYLEAFASLYELIIADIRRVEMGKKPEGGYPNVHDGLRGMQFIEAAVESSHRGTIWVDLQHA